MSSDNPSNDTNTNSSSPTTPSSRPKLTLNFSKNLPEELAKKLEALKPKEKIVEASIKPEPQIQVQDQRQQKEQSQKAHSNSQNNNTIDTTKRPNNSRAIISDTKIKANVASPVKADKIKVQTTLDTISDAQLASKEDKSTKNNTSAVGTDTTMVNATIKDKKQSTATSAVATDNNYNSKAEAVNANTANTEDKSDNAETQDKAESELKLAPQNKKWLLKPQIYKKMIEEFRADFPNCFTMPKKPLALSIRTELIKTKPDYSKTEIGKFLQIYCGEKTYKQALTLDAERVNLNGEVSSLVTEEQLAKDKHNLKSENKEAQ